MSLEEILITLVLNTLLFLGFFQIYELIDHKLNFIELELELAYKYHVVDFILRSNIVQAGYKGPVTAWYKNFYSSINSSNNKLVPEAAIGVCQSTGFGCKNLVTLKFLHKIKNLKIKPNSNILLIYDIPNQVTLLEHSMLKFHSPLKVAKNFIKSLNVGDQLIIANFNFSQRFIISNIIGEELFHDEPHNFKTNFITNFKSGAEIFSVKHLAFYLAKNENKTSTYSLYMDYLEPDSYYHAHALVDDIVDFKVKIIKHAPNKGAVTENAPIGWVFNKYLLIELLLQGKSEIKNFQIGIELRNV